MDSLACPKCDKVCTGKVGLAAHVRHCKVGTPASPEKEPVTAPAAISQKADAVSVVTERGGYSVLFDGSYVIENKYGTVIGRFPTEADALLNLQGLQRFRR